MLDEQESYYNKTQLPWDLNSEWKNLSGTGSWCGNAAIEGARNGAGNNLAIMGTTLSVAPGLLFTKKTPSYQYRDSHYKPETVVRPS